MSSPLDDFRQIVADFAPIALAEVTASGRHGHSGLMSGQDSSGPLGRLGELGHWLASCQRRAVPRMNRPLTVIFAGSHGVAASAFPHSSSRLTEDLLHDLQEGRSAANHLAGSMSAGLKVFDLMIGTPTRDISTGPAMSERECSAALAFGMEAVIESPDALAVGEIGLGGGVAASALVAFLYGGDPDFWSRVGGWTPADIGKRRTEAVQRALLANRGQLEDPLEALCRLGGRELAATAGAIAAARVQGIPVVLDGFVTCAAAAVLKQMNDCALDHCVAAHVSAEPAHQALLDRIDKVPLFDLGIRFGEGVGSTLAFSLLRGACAVLEGEGAKVSA